MRALRLALFGLPVLCGLIWATGTSYAIYNVHQKSGTCRVPFLVWAYTWPLWVVLPDNVLLWSQTQALAYCDRELHPT